MHHKLIQDAEAKKDVLTAFHRARAAGKKGAIVNTKLGEHILGTGYAISFLSDVVRYYNSNGVLCHEEYGEDVSRPSFLTQHAGLVGHA